MQSKQIRKKCAKLYSNQISQRKQRCSSLPLLSLLTCMLGRTGFRSLWDSLKNFMLWGWTGCYYISTAFWSHWTIYSSLKKTDHFDILGLRLAIHVAQSAQTVLMWESLLPGHCLFLAWNGSPPHPGRRQWLWLSIAAIAADFDNRKRIREAGCTQVDHSTDCVWPA